MSINFTNSENLENSTNSVNSTKKLEIKFTRQDLLEVKLAKEDLLILSAKEAKELDANIIKAGTAGFDLMQRAASASMQAVLLRWPHCKNFTIFCGSGNNAGDGIVLAQLLIQAGKQAKCVLVGGNNFVNEAKQAFDLAIQNKVEFLDFSAWQQNFKNSNAESEIGEEVFIDALFGVGLNKNPNGAYKDAIDAMNNSRWQVCALDLPSGINSQTQEEYSPCIKADLTITFLALKRGLLDTKNKDKIGRLYLANLGFKAEDFLDFSQTKAENPNTEKSSQRIYLPSLNSIKLEARSDLAHKGNNGKLLVIGGDLGTAGAVGLTASAALRAGAGIVKVLTRQSNSSWLLARNPELVLAYPHLTKQIIDLLQDCDALAIGTGLGTNAWGRNLWNLVAQHYTGICVMDADALNLLSEKGKVKLNDKLRKNMCITPHPKEAARLLQTSVDEVEADRFATCKKLMALSDYGILKGADSLVFAGEKIYFSNFGNGGMASAGMGDILTGIVGGLLAQGISLEQSILTACIAHAKSGDMAAKKIGKRGLIATDLLEFIPSFLN